MPRYAASGLGFHCLRMSHRKDARLIWVKSFEQRITIQYAFTIQPFSLGPNLFFLMLASFDAEDKI